MSKVLLVTLTKDKTCRKCTETIKAGETAVKTTTVKSSCSETYATEAYLHQGCWTPGKKGR